MTFNPKDWRDGPAGGTRINAASLKELEERLSDYTDESVDPLVAADTTEASVRAAADTAIEAQVADLGDQISSSSVDKTYRHQQMVPSAVWTIAHGLGKRPSVDAFDSSGNVLIGEPEHIDDNNLTIDVGVATGGEAYCN